MAKCIFFNLPGASGHINPTVGLVSELIAKGEQVIYYAGEDTRAKFEKLGAEYRTYDQWFTYHHTAATASDILTMAKTEIDLMLDALVPMLEQIKKDAPDYIVYDSCCVWGKYLAESLKIPGITIITTLVSSHWLMLSDWRLASHVLFSVLIPGASLIVWARRVAKDLFEQIGVQWRGIFYHIFDFFACVGDLNIVFNTRQYQPFADRIPGNFHYVGASIPEGRDSSDMDFSRYEGKKLIYVSLGTIHNMDVGFYKTVMQGLGETADLEVIMSVGKNTRLEDLGSIPSNFTVRNFVPQLEVLKRADVFITHGGMNSLNEGLYYGVPVIVVPQQVEQAFNARRLAKLGVATPLPTSDINPASIRRVVRDILDNPDYRRNAKQYGETLRQAGGYKAAAEKILAFVR